jgi:hypothetical protein
MMLKMFFEHIQESLERWSIIHLKEFEITFGGVKVYVGLYFHRK